jgi:hypothetical protein
MNDSSRGVWVSRLNALHLKLYGGATAVVGLILLMLVRQANGLSATTSNSALFLGFLLLIPGWVGEQWNRPEMEARRQRLIGYLEESA